jgi:hypothetical protein
MSPNSAANSRANRACMVTMTGARDQGQDREEARRGQHDGATQPEFLQCIVHNPAYAASGSQAGQNMRQAHKLL